MGFLAVRDRESGAGMRIQEKHVSILREIQDFTSQYGHAELWQVIGLNGKTERSLKALIRGGYVEEYKDGHNPNGTCFYRLGGIGVAGLLEDAIETESRDIAVRVAERMRGMDPETIRKAGTKYKSVLYGQIAEAIEDGDICPGCLKEKLPA